MNFTADNLHKKTFKQILIFILLFTISTLVFYNLKGFRREGGDSGQMVNLVDASNDFQYYYRSPGIFILYQSIFFSLHKHGLNGEKVIAITSSLAGGFFICVLLLISRNPIFLLLNIFSGIVFIFMGHLENYAWVNALLALMYLLGMKYLEGKVRFHFIVLVWVIACFMHMLAVFFMPVILYLFVNPNKENALSHRDNLISKLNLPSKPEIEKSLIFLISFLLIIIFAPIVLRNRVIMLDVGSLRLVPLFKITNPRHYFTMFSLGHIQMMFYFISNASLIGIPLLILLAYRIKTPVHIMLLIGFLCGILWAFVWHPDMGYGDWDLFSSFAIPLNLLNGIIAAEICPLQKIDRFFSRLI